jgi:hypothetical protein
LKKFGTKSADPLHIGRTRLNSSSKQTNFARCIYDEELTKERIDMALIPRSLEDFINNNKFLITNNPLFNLAVANMRISRALQRALNNQAKAVSAIADQINRVSDLSTIVQILIQKLLLEKIKKMQSKY